MKLIGELTRSFGNFMTLRGVADIKNLAKVSFADPGYQRDLKEKHGETMQKFLEEGGYTFFPEVILSVSLDNIESTLSKQAKQFYESVPYKSVKKTIFDKFKLKAITQKFSSQGDSRAQTYFCKGELDILENDKILQRIDGNHRLSVADNLDKDLTIPFCIIFYSNAQQAKKFNRVLFNNINYKSLPLSSEENLHLIFEEEQGEYIFSNDELSDPIWFGEEYIAARKLYKTIQLDNLDIIQSILQKDGKDIFTRTMLLDLTKLKLKNNITSKNLQEALQAVNQCYGNYGQKNSGYQLIVVHLYYYFMDKLFFFSNWVKENHIYELNKVDAKGLISLFDKVLEAKEKTIFLAMPFDEKADQNSQAVEDAINSINKNLCENLELKFIRIDKSKTGYSFAITDEILKNIESGGYLIADITLANPNVYYEIGYQMGLNKGSNNKQNNFLLIHNSGVSEFDKDKHFNIANISIEAAKDSIDLREKVKKQLKTYYGLGDE